MNQQREILPQRLLLRISEAAEVLGLSRAFVYALIAKNELPTVRVGRAVRISYSSLQRWIAQRETEREDT
jgi:excisionase family DNA binding protein